MSTQSTTSSTSIAGLLGVLFVGLKLTHVIDWSWWWVLAPFWIPLTLVFLVLLAVGSVAMIKGRK
ncbi:hypothetical protein [Arthrobacter bambusae]|uniref:hypothetical protein n=1 Tax=Arthrobacter bambusae TaxID=1338426 RepID=UPI00277DB4D2|nr:hypothetical protein [Arthrobacter bambusae]MDQ0241197.1 phosphoglycerol transferase MdoB-like AlkP superfamily enzyme [Arthrobacter bambusae]